MTVILSILSIRHVWPTKGTFECETIYKMEFFPHYYSCGRFSSFLNLKIAILHTEVLRSLRKEKRKNSLFQPICSLILTAVHENIFLPRMTMNVTIKYNISAFQSFPYHLFDSIYLWVKLRCRQCPLTI